MCVPIGGSDPCGLVCITHTVANQLMDADAKRALIFKELADSRIDALANIDRVVIAAGLDPLTRALNRRGLAAEIKKLPGGKAWALYQLDADNFKEVNDQLGHDFGDRVLQDLVTALAALAPGRVCRMGGEEFVVIEERAAGVSLQDQARAFHRQIALSRPINRTRGAPRQPVTVSMGAVEASTAQLRLGFDGLVKRADALAMQAKCLHKNRVEVQIARRDTPYWNQACTHGSHTVGQHILDGMPKRK